MKNIYSADEKITVNGEQITLFVLKQALYENQFNHPPGEMHSLNNFSVLETTNNAKHICVLSIAGK